MDARNPLVIYGQDNDKNCLPIQVAVDEESPQKSYLFCCLPHIGSQKGSGCTYNGRRWDPIGPNTWFIVVGCFRALWQGWKEVFGKGWSDEEIEQARVKAFESNLVLDQLTAGRFYTGTSTGVAWVMSLLCLIFKAKFRQNRVVTGEVTPSGDVCDTGSEALEADTTFWGGKKCLVLPQVCKDRLLQEREKRKKEGVLREGDSLELVGYSTLWEAIKATLVEDMAGELSAHGV